MKVLITAGGTEEPIDGVRRLTNTSSGATGGVLGRHFVGQGAEVLLLHAERSPLKDVGCRRETFVTFSDLEGALHRHLSGESWDAIVHLAAVGDYAVGSITVDGVAISVDGRGKIGSGREVILRLKANPKIIDQLRGWSLNPNITLVGFKLTDHADSDHQEKAVNALMVRARPDLVIHNDLSEIGPNRHEARFIDHAGLVARTRTKDEMARTLWKLITIGGAS